MGSREATSKVEKAAREATPKVENVAEVKCAAIQAPSAFADTPANVKYFTKLIEEAAENGAKIIVLPETAITGYTSQDFLTLWNAPGREDKLPRRKKGMDPSKHAIEVDGPEVQHFKRLCAELKVFVSVPFVEKRWVADEDGPKEKEAGEAKTKQVFHNTICLIDDEGNLAGHYRKVNLWPYVDLSCFTAGQDLCVVDTKYGRVGLGVCYDVHVIFDLYKPLNLWTLLYSIAWVDNCPPHTEEWFDHTLPTKFVRKGGFNTVAANWSTDNKQEDWSGQGCSRIYDKNGRILASAKTKLGPEIIYANLPAPGPPPPNARVTPDQLHVKGRLEPLREQQLLASLLAKK